MTVRGARLALKIWKFTRRMRARGKLDTKKSLLDCYTIGRNGKRKVDVALVWALDRLSREEAAAILNLIHIQSLWYPGNKLSRGMD